MKTLIILLLSLGLSSDSYKSYTATAYCLKGKTASGEYVRSGIIAADPKVLKIGTKVHILAGKYSGYYIVKDTGRLIKGRRIDLWIKDCKECLQFGKQSVKIKIIG